MELIWRARSHAEDFQETLAGDKHELPALDPLVVGIVQTAHYWYLRMGVPIIILHDKQNMITPARADRIMYIMAHLTPEFRRFMPLVHVKEIRQVDSKDDASVQVADLLCGAARSIAENELLGVGDPELAAALRPYIDDNSLWDDDRSWEALKGKAGY